MLVFRNNIAYTRYWEGITQLRQMSAKWGDVRYRGRSNLPHLDHLPPHHSRPTAPCCRHVCSPLSSCSPWTATRSLAPTRRSRDSIRSARRGSSTARPSATASLTPITS